MVSGHYRKVIEIYFSKGLPKPERRTIVRIKRGERGIWQRSFWEHAIRDDRDYEKHMDYLHFNPVKHGDVDKVIDCFDWTNYEQKDSKMGES